eukprot:4872235-Amphidinium_carterae.1
MPADAILATIATHSAIRRWGESLESSNCPSNRNIFLTIAVPDHGIQNKSLKHRKLRSHHAT